MWKEETMGSWEGMENEGKRSSLEPLEPGLIILQETVWPVIVLLPSKQLAQ